MMKRLIIALVSVALLCASLTSALADTSIIIEESGLNTKTKVVTISGNVGKEKLSVSLRMFNPDKTFADALSNPTTAYQAVDEVVSAKDGSFKFAFTLNIDPAYGFKGGNANYYIDCDGSEYKGVMYLATQEEIDAAIEELNKRLISKNGVAEFLSDNADRLNFSTPLFEAVKVSEVASILQAEYDENPSVAIDNASIQDAVQLAAIISAYNEGVSTSYLLDSSSMMLYKEVNLLDMDSLDSKLGVSAYSYFVNSTTPGVRTKIVAAMEGNSFKNVNDLYEKFVEEVVLLGIPNPKNSGTGHIDGLLTENASVTGLNLNSYNKLTNAQKNKVAIALSKQSFNSTSDLQTKLNKAVSDAVASSTPTGGGGGGGGGGGVSAAGYGDKSPVSSSKDTVDSLIEWLVAPFSVKDKPSTISTIKSLLNGGAK